MNIGLKNRSIEKKEKNPQTLVAQTNLTQTDNMKTLLYILLIGILWALVFWAALIGIDRKTTWLCEHEGTYCNQ